MPDSSTETAEAASVHSTLKTGLKKRHLTMLSMGGVIGAGFFVGLERNHQPGRPRRSHHVARSAASSCSW